MNTITGKNLGIRLISPTDFYNLKDEKKINYIKRVQKFICNGTNKLLKSMCTITEKNLQSYKNDFFVHDFFSLIEYDGIAIWLTRDSGTDLIKLVSDKETMINSFRWFEAVKHNNRKYYILDFKNETIKKITLQQAEKVINNHMTKHCIIID